MNLPSRCHFNNVMIVLKIMDFCKTEPLKCFYEKRAKNPQTVANKPF